VKAAGRKTKFLRSFVRSAAPKALLVLMVLAFTSMAPFAGAQLPPLALRSDAPVHRPTPRVTLEGASAAEAGAAVSVHVTWRATESGAFRIWLGGDYCGHGMLLARGEYRASGAVVLSARVKVPVREVDWIRVCITDTAGNTGSDAGAVDSTASSAPGETSRADRAQLLLGLAALAMLFLALLILLGSPRRTPVMRSAEPRDDGRAARLYTDLVLYRRLFRQARPYWPHIAGVFALSLLATPLALLAPVPLKIAVDSVVGSKPLPGFLEAVLPESLSASDAAVLAVAAGLIIAVALVQQFQTLGSTVLGAYAGEKLMLDFRSRLFRHVQSLSLTYHDAKGTADSTYRIQYDAASIKYIAIYGVAPFVTAGFTVAGMIYVTARLDRQLALVALGVVPVLFALTSASRRRLRGGWRETKNIESSAMSVVQEVLSGLRVVKAFVQEDREHERFMARSGEGVRARIRLAILEGGFSGLVGLTTAIGTGLVLFIGVRHVQAGTLSLGSLMLVMAYLLQLYAPLQQITKSVAMLQAQLASAERVFSVLDEAPDVPEKPDAVPLRRARGEIIFDDVSFGYPGNPPAIEHISFAVEPGMRVGIAGTTGSGKTTLASLLMRLYDPSSGTIRLDGVDLRDYRLADLRNQFAIVLQEPVLFSTTIAENIGYGRQGAGFDELVAAAEAANAHDFITALPDGYDTLVGERGMRLSGGERQRISLARAFLKDAPILVLDEPTSSVDVKTEAAIMEAMERLMRGRTTLMIAHRLSTLDHCDERIEVESGQLVQHEVVPLRSVRLAAAASSQHRR
jgi:ATP-binding cassette subfamily B protein